MSLAPPDLNRITLSDRTWSGLSARIAAVLAHTESMRLKMRAAQIWASCAAAGGLGDGCVKRIFSA